MEQDHRTGLFEDIESSRSNEKFYKDILFIGMPETLFFMGLFLKFEAFNRLIR